jgi:serine/threonine-protein kinase SRPK3
MGAQRKLNCPRVYAAPEVMFDELVSPASDVWAMGNLLHYILSGGQEMGSSVISGRPNPTDEEVLKNIVLALGKLPNPWWQRWEERRKHFDEEARPAEGVRGISRLVRTSKAYIKEEESEVFEKVLWGMFDYNPRMRLTSREVANRLEWLAS